MVFETLKVRREGGVLFADIAGPPMNLLGPSLVRDLVSLIQRAEADGTVRALVFKSADPDYFIAHVDVTQIKEYRAEETDRRGVSSSQRKPPCHHRRRSPPASSRSRIESTRSPSRRWRISAAIPISSARVRKPPRPKADSKLR
jgi:hypothetical protein